MKFWKKISLAIAALAAALGITIGGSQTTTPTPEPTAVPTVEPTAVPTVAPTVEPSPAPTTEPTAAPTTSPSTGFPIRFPVVGTIVDMRASRYGNGVQATPRIATTDEKLCKDLHGPAGHVPCHLDSTVWVGATAEERDLQRANYEGLILAGAREGLTVPAAPLGPVWQYRAVDQLRRCHQREDDVDNTSCDHFGSPASGWRDDPKTKEFEGKPGWLVAQTDEYGPYAGWFMVPQTSGALFGTQVRACPPLSEGDGAVCSPWVSVDWK